MKKFYRSPLERQPDYQYQNLIKTILKDGELVKDTPQGIGALTCFGTLPPLVYDLRNGVPLITERKLGYRMPIAEIIAFINGARTIDEIKSFGCNFWDEYQGQGRRIGLEPNDMGPGSYGPAFAAFEKPDGTTLNQFKQLLQQLRECPSLRTHLITPWKPYYTARGPERKVIVAPCHGWLHFRVLNDKLHMIMSQRSADMPIGVPNNMIQYAALLLMVCQVTGLQPGNYIHKFNDAHIYENQIHHMKELVRRAPRMFPTLHLETSVTDLFAFRKEHFKLESYDPHDKMEIPYTP